MADKMIAFHTLPSNVTCNDSWWYNIYSWCNKSSSIRNSKIPDEEPICSWHIMSWCMREIPVNWYGTVAFLTIAKVGDCQLFRVA